MPGYKHHDTIKVNPLNPIVHFWFIITVHCTEKAVSACLCAGSTSPERVGSRTGGGRWGHPQVDMLVVAARLSCKSATVGTV